MKMLVSSDLNLLLKCLWFLPKPEEWETSLEGWIMYPSLLNLVADIAELQFKEKNTRDTIVKTGYQ